MLCKQIRDCPNVIRSSPVVTENWLGFASRTRRDETLNTNALTFGFLVVDMGRRPTRAALKIR